jgi:hypothetical protein
VLALFPAEGFLSPRTELPSGVVGEALTNDERAAIARDGALVNDPLWFDDEVHRWRRYLDVIHNFTFCDQCERWIGRTPEEPCTHC